MARIVTDGTAYVNLSQVDTVAQYQLGLKVLADSGEYIYGQASGAIDEGAAVSYEVTATDCQFAELTTGTANLCVGGACEALADNEYGWAWIGGSGGYDNLLVAAGVADNVALKATATPGELDGGAGSAVVGALTAAASGAGGLTACRSTTGLRSA